MSFVRKILLQLSSSITSTTFRHFHVTVVGGANEIGQTLCLLLKTQPAITKLIIHDTEEQIPGVVLDMSHIPTSTSLKVYNEEENLDKALKDSDLIIATGGTIYKPGLTKKSCLSTNTAFIHNLTIKISKIYPMPFVGIVTEPINTLVPMAAEIMRHHGDYNSKKLFGITTIDSLRAQALYAEKNQLNAFDCIVPVIGGHSDKTIVPLISQTKPVCAMNEESIQEFTTKIRKCDEMVTNKKTGWSPTLSIAYSVLIFTREILNALDDKPTKVNAFVENNDFGTSYFSGQVFLDKKGAGEMERYSNLSQYECELLEYGIHELRKDVLQGKKILELV